VCMETNFSEGGVAERSRAGAELWGRLEGAGAHCPSRIKLQQHYTTARNTTFDSPVKQSLCLNLFYFTILTHRKNHA
jgi:hypothetical protein